MSFLSKIKSLIPHRKKKPLTLGLALGSGGAKGMAHLGVLKAFEEEGISFQIVTGTSIGSIVGALYASGYSSADMTSIMGTLNAKEFAGKLRPFADMNFIEEFLSQYLEGNIENLPKPFSAWATDASTNEGALLNEGNLCKALCASSAIPPVFRAVEIEGVRLADGAYTNAIPADVCRDMGADFVVGCDLSAFVKPDEEKGGLQRLLEGALNAIVSLRYQENHKTRGYEASDIMLRPNLLEFKATDVSRTAMELMYERGYEEARARMPEILAALKAAGFARK